MGTGELTEGAELGPSGWIVVDQERIDAFADATLDHQFIHVDNARAADTPFGGTIAHGYLTLSLLPHLTGEILPMPAGTVMAVNYGLDRLRFLAPVKAGSEVRARATVAEVAERAPGQMLIKTEVTVDIKGEDKPALVAETLTMAITAG